MHFSRNYLHEFLGDIKLISSDQKTNLGLCFDPFPRPVDDKDGIAKN